MPRYFFHIRDSIGLIRDTDGLELPSLDHALKEAQTSARSLAEQRKYVPSRCVVEIWNEQGNVVASVPVFLPS